MINSFNIFGFLTATVVFIAALFKYKYIFIFPRVSKGTVAFFHPFADGGGGGERVLWCAVKAVQQACVGCKVLIYVRSGVTAAELQRDACQRFNIELTHAVEVCHLAKTNLILPELYPRFTLLGQALGAVALGYEALSSVVPEVFIDTTGWAFTYPLAWLAGSRVACYVHYPTVSTNMMERVRKRSAGYNNSGDVAGSFSKSLLKLLYYRLFARIYGFCGAFSSVTLVNSSWTAGHIQALWWGGRRPGGPQLLYPPCDTLALSELPLERPAGLPTIVSVQQFRPEKNHRLQLDAFALLKKNADTADVLRSARLLMVGSCRNDDDRVRLQELQKYAKDLQLEDCVEWHVNVSFSELVRLLGSAWCGLHTMVDEHFGISVVEYMAAGAIPVANRSGGPRSDIVVNVQMPDGEANSTGFLAATVEEYAAAMSQVLTMSSKDRLRIAAAARKHVVKFSSESFISGFSKAMQPIMPSSG